MSCTTIAENMSGLQGEIAKAEATRNEVIAIMARQEKVPAELWQRLLATSPGVSEEDIQAKINLQMADGEDVKCRVKAGEVTANELRDAQRASGEMGAQVDFVGRVFQAIVACIFAALGEVQQAKRARVADLWCEVNRLRSAPNKANIAGRQRHLDDLHERIQAAEGGLRSSVDGHDYNSHLHVIADLRKQLAAAESAPFEFSSEANIPPPLPAFDLAATVIGIVVDELRKAIPLGQRGDVFTQVSAAFKEANPVECLADCRRILAKMKEEAAAAGEQEAVKQVA